MESQFTTLSMMGLSALLNITVTVLIVIQLCRSRLICSFNKSSLVLFNLLIFIFCTILIRLDISMGTGVGLFAVLAMFRFRSQVLKTQEMFYLLMLIGIGFVHAAFPNVLSLMEVIFIDIVLIGMAFVLTFFNKASHSFRMTIDDLELIKPENKEKFESVLKEKTGFDIKKVEILEINMNKGRAQLRVETSTTPAVNEPAEEVIHQVPDFNTRQLEITPVRTFPIAAN